MAHEWDSYFPNLQPPSSDSTALRVPSNSGENFSQQAEDLTEHHDFSNMADSQEIPSTNLNVNANFYTNSSTSRSDCVYQRYYGDTPWQTGGQQAGNDGPPSRWRGSNLSGLATSGHVPSPVAYGYDQDCGMLNSSYAEGYSDVSNGSEADVNAARSTCKLMNRNSDEMTTCHNSHVTEKPDTWQWPFTSTGNASPPARSHCGSTQETPLVVQSSSFSESSAQENVVDHTGESSETVQDCAKAGAQNDQLSGISESITTSDNESEEDMNEHDDSQVQQQEEQGVEELDTSLGDCGNLAKAEKEGKPNGKEEEQTYLKEDLDQETTVVTLNRKVQGDEEEVSDTHKDPRPHLISTDDKDNVSPVKNVDQEDELQSSTTPEPSDSQSNKETQVQLQERRGVEGKEQVLVSPVKKVDREDELQSSTTPEPSDSQSNKGTQVQLQERHGMEGKEQVLVSPVKVDREDELQSSTTPEPSDSQSNKETQVQLQERRGVEGKEQVLVSPVKKVDREDELQSSTTPEPSDSQSNKGTQVQLQERHGMEGKEQVLVSPVKKVDREDELQSSTTPEPSDSQSNKGTQVQLQERHGMEGKEQVLVSPVKVDREDELQSSTTPEPSDSQSNKETQVQLQERRGVEGKEQVLVSPVKKLDREDELQSSTTPEPSDSQSNKGTQVQLQERHGMEGKEQVLVSPVKKVDREDELQSSPTPEPSDSQSNKETQVQLQERRGVAGKEHVLVQEKQLDASLGDHGHSTEDDNKENTNGEEMYPKDLDQETTVVAPNSDGKDDLDGKVQGNDQEEVIDRHEDPGPSPISTDSRDEKSTTKKVDQDERSHSSTSDPSHLQGNMESDIQNDTVKPGECGASEDNSDVDGSESNSQNDVTCLQVPASCQSTSQDTIRSGPVNDGESDPVGENDKQSFDLSESCLKKEEQSLQQMDTEPQGPNGGFPENASESSQEEIFAPEQEPMLYGEPLSGEESDGEACKTRSDSNPTKGDHTGINDEETTNNLEAQTVQLKSSVQMRKRLQPIVILKTSEATHDADEVYQCAECQQTTQNVDHLIEHHHLCHSQHKFKCCQTCNIYLMRDVHAEKHLCGVTEDVPEPLVGFTLKRKYKSTPHKCKFCSQTFPRFILYVKHMRTHTGTTPYRCDKCGIYFAQGSSLRKHQRIARRCRGAKPAVSTRNAADEGSVKEIKRAPDGSYTNLRECYVKLTDVTKCNVCHTCCKSFRTEDKLHKHRYNVHRQTKSGVISILYKGPFITHHPEDKKCNKPTEVIGKHKCPFCPRVFKYFYNRNRHLRDCVKEITFGSRGQVGNRFPCPLCHTAYTLSSNRSRHIKKTCLKEYIGRLTNPDVGSTKQIPAVTKQMPAARKLERNVPHLKCSLCPAVFLHQSGKYRHMKKHELFKSTGKLFKYRHSSFGSISRQTRLNSRKTESKRETDSTMETESKRETESKDTLPSNADSSSSSLTCRYCGKTNFSTSYSLKKHEHNHKGEKPYRCLECRKSFKKECYLIAHRIVHQRRIQCTVCRKILPTVSELIQHRQSHIKKGMLQCPDCPMKFQFPVYLLRHLATHHKRGDEEAPELQEPTPQNLQQPLPCKSCGKQFRSKKYTKIHQEKCRTKPKPVGTKHGPKIGLKEFICSYCPRVFSRPNRLRKHHVAHKSKSLLPCSKCGQCFGRTKITSHHKNCYGTSKPKVDLSNHSGDLPKNPIIKASKTTGAGAKILLHNCPHCQHKFKYRSFLLRHLISHTREQPFTCMHCGQKYDHKSQYLQHEAFCDGSFRERQSKIKGEVATKLLFTSTSTEAKPKRQADGEGEYKCKFCTKTFTKSRNLRRHILSHTEVKPYRCKACDNCFSRYDHLKLHETRCKGKRRRVELCIPKISLDDIGKNWRVKLDKLNIGKRQTLDCKNCSRSFSSQTNLARHSAMLHPAPKKPYSCTRCDSSFSHEKSLRSHKRLNKCKRPSIKTNEPLQVGSHPQRENMTTVPPRVANRILQRIQPYSKEKRCQYSCEYCPRVFKGSEQLKVHTRLHTGEKPFQCDDCGEGFIRKDYLLRHASKCDQRKGRTESTLCDRCGGAFSKEKLKSHQRSCTLPTPLPTRSQQPAPPSPPKGFSCACCNSRFLLFSQLQQHFLYAHKQETALKPQASAPPLQQQLLSIKDEPSDEGYGDRQLSGDGNLLFDQDSGSDNEIVKPLACPHCDMRFVSKGGLSAHIRLHSGRFPFTCKVCKKGFWNRNLHRNHSRKCRFRVVATKDHGTDLESGAPITSEMDLALNDSVLVFNQSSKTTGTGVLQTNFSCKDDLKDARPQTSTEKLEQSCSSKKKAVQYQCSECDKSFTDGLMLISHLEDHGRVEQEKKRNTCPQCGKICGSSSYLEKHMKMHADEATELEDDAVSHDPNKPLVCKVCKQRFISSHALCNHYNEAHPKDVYTCYICEKSYSLKTSLSRHYRMRHRNAKRRYVRGPVEEQNNTDEESHTDINADDESDIDDDYDDESDGSEDSDSAPYFPCHVCGKTFHTSESLEDHQRCHLGEKPHECAECGKCFFHASQLQQHQRTHKSEFQCQTCNRGFVSLFALRKHKHTHGKSRPYRCSKCTLSFKGPSQLADHMATHRDDNFPCDICNRTFSCKSSRAEHRKKSHSKSQSGRSLSTLSPSKSQSGRSLPTLSPSARKKMTPPATSPSESSSTTLNQLKYRCGVCHDRFKDPEDLSEHGCLAAKERPYSCTECNKYFLHGSHLKRHRDTHHVSQTYIYLCTQCKMSFAYRQHYISHLKRHGDNDNSAKDEQGPPKIYKCSLCPTIFANALKLVEHFAVHTDDTHECKICKLSYASKSELEEHERCHQTAGTQYECTECDESFLGSDAFRQHRCSRRRHEISESEDAHPSTAEGPASSKLVTGEEEEVDVTGEDFHNCPLCSKRFSSKSALLEHQNKHHPAERPFKCEICGKAFNLRKYLRRHVMRHSEKVDADCKTGEIPPVEKPFKCSRCPVELDTAQELSLHMREHAEEEVGDHRCDMCYKSFSQRSLLRQHQESHVGQVVYECNECDKAFAFPHLLEEHQKTHSTPSV